MKRLSFLSGLVGAFASIIGLFITVFAMVGRKQIVIADWWPLSLLGLVLGTLLLWYAYSSRTPLLVETSDLEVTIHDATGVHGTMKKTQILRPLRRTSTHRDMFIRTDGTAASFRQKVLRLPERSEISTITEPIAKSSHYYNVISAFTTSLRFPHRYERTLEYEVNDSFTGNAEYFIFHCDLVVRKHARLTIIFPESRCCKPTSVSGEQITAGGRIVTNGDPRTPQPKCLENGARIEWVLAKPRPGDIFRLDWCW